MFWDLIATVAAGFVVGGVVLMLRRLLRLPLPKWALPAAAGAAMIAYSVWSEYSWYGRMEASLPPSVEIALTNQDRAWWRPWTYLRPITTRFVAFDREATLSNQAAPGQRLVTLLLFGRWEPTRSVQMIYDCAGERRAPVAQGGTVADADWQPVPADDPVLPLVCAEAGS